MLQLLNHPVKLAGTRAAGERHIPGCFQAHPASTMYLLEKSKIASLASVPALHTRMMRQPTLNVQHNDGIPGLLDL